MRKIYQNGIRLNLKSLDLSISMIIVLISFLIAFHDYSYWQLAMLYAILNLSFFFVPIAVSYALPSWIIRITGFIRYMILPFVAEGVVVSSEVMVIMGAELLSVYFAIYIFSYNKKIKIIEPSDNQDENIIDTHLGMAVFIILLSSIVVIIRNPNYILNYIYSLKSKVLVDSASGFFDIMVNVALFIIWIKLLFKIQKMHYIHNFLKVLISLSVSYFWINGRAISVKDISRWTLILSIIVAIYFIIELYPQYKKKMLLGVAIVIPVTIILGTTMKWNRDVRITDDVVKESIKQNFDYKTLNAYFSGYSNVNEIFDVDDSIRNAKTSRLKIFVTDTINNFPYINNFLDKKQYSSAKLFNYAHYGSWVASDQIIPLVGQSFIYLSVLFPIMIFIITWFAYKFNYFIKLTKNLMLKYCLIKMAFNFSLGNCINWTIMCSGIWLDILPIYLIYLFNTKLLLNKKGVY